MEIDSTTCHQHWKLLVNHPYLPNNPSPPPIISIYRSSIYLHTQQRNGEATMTKRMSFISRFLAGLPSLFSLITPLHFPSIPKSLTVYIFIYRPSAQIVQLLITLMSLLLNGLNDTFVTFSQKV